MLELPAVYGQRDPNWGALQLGLTPGATIHDFGCKLTSFADAATYYGHPITPDALNARFVAAGLYVAGDLLGDDPLWRIFPDCTFVGQDDYRTVPADLGKLRDYLTDDSVFVIAQISAPPEGFQLHFAPVMACDGSAVTIADPWFGEVAPLTDHYGPHPEITLQRYLVYRGTPAAAQQQPSADPLNGVAGLTDAQRALLELMNPAEGMDGYDPAHPGLFIDADGVRQKVAERDALTAENAQLHQQVDQLTQALTAAQAEAARTPELEQRALHAADLLTQAAALLTGAA